ncbi:MAG TPA: MFS transporter [Xanthobacteraceae bacterium]|nr:MFS transporter [Xanthobacteraceae bacterium]
MPQPVSQMKAWLIVTLLFFFMFINFADKLVIGLAAGPIMRDLELTPSQFGYIASSFFFLFSLSGLCTGFIVNRVATKYALTAMSLVWAAAQFLVVGAASYGTLLTSRILLGAGEGPATPVSLHSLYKWFENERRTFPASIMNSLGAAAGVFASAPILAWIIQAYGWQAAFGTLGVVGLMWVALWLLLGAEGPISDPVPEQGASTVEWPRISYGRLLTSRTFIGSVCCGFAAYWTVTLVVSWVPSFLNKSLGYDSQTAAWLVSLESAIAAGFAFLVGWASQAMLQAGVSSRRARGLLTGAFAVASGIALCSMTYLPSDSVKLALLIAGLAIPNGIYPLVFAMVGEIVPTRQRGAALATLAAIFTSAGLVAPTVMGYAVERGATVEGGFSNGFLVTSAILLAAGVIGLLIINPEADRSRILQGSVPDPASSLVTSAGR